MAKSFLRDRRLLFLLALTLLVKLFSLWSTGVERWYTYGFYPAYARLLRVLLGWIPLSLGDVLYTAAFIFLAAKAWKLGRLLLRRQLRDYLSWGLFRKYLRLSLVIYLVFNLSWGLNYNRTGIAGQLGLNVSSYSAPELLALTRALQLKLNAYAAQEDTVDRRVLDQNRLLFREGIANYAQVAKEYPFLRYASPSVKPSLFSAVGHYFGFSGYLNPFTGEAQLNTAEPVFVKPFVVDHEIAHQLGYGKENEANFVSYLACRHSNNLHFRYSVYYELYFDALYEYAQTRDTAALRELKNTLHPRARRDKLEELQLRLKRKNGMQPYVADFYNNYLKLNNQPRGLATYNEVIAWLIGYGKKFGTEAL